MIGYVFFFYIWKRIRGRDLNWLLQKEQVLGLLYFFLSYIQRYLRPLWRPPPTPLFYSR